MPKRSTRLPLLAVLCLPMALVCVAAIFIWLNFGASEQPEGTAGQTEQQQQSIGTTTGETTPPPSPGPTDISSSTSETAERRRPPSFEQPSGPAEQLMEALSPGPSPVLDEVTARAQSQHAPRCAQPSLDAAAAAECVGRSWIASTSSASQSQTSSGSWLDDQQPHDQLRAYEYALNISLPGGQSLHGQLSILAELRVETAMLALDCGRELGAISETEVRVWHCQSGTFLCVRSLTRLLDRQLLLIELAEPLAAGALLRLHFSHLRVPLLASPALLVQTPSPWERDRAWLLASQFPLAGGVRALFPAVDWPQARAVFRLCLAHSPETLVRANTRAELSQELPGGGQVQTCFRETPPLPPAQFAFALFRQLRPVPPAGDGNSKRAVELFIGAHLQPQDYGWALAEMEQAMVRMRELTGLDYPLDRLTLISSPLPAGNDAVGGLGLAQIRDSWIEYPKFVHTHSLVVGQVVRQWTANLVFLCDRCLHRALSLFLEWLLAAELGPAEDKSAEFKRRVGEVRQRLLGPGPALRTDPGEKCAERAAFVLHMLDSAFGRPAMVSFLGLLFRRHSWDAKCTSTAALSQLFLEANQGQAQAQRVFDSFLLPANEATNFSSPVPFVSVSVQPQSSLLLLAQQSHNDDDSNRPLPWVPVAFVDDTGKSTTLVLNSSELALPVVVSSFLIAQPTSFARLVYNVENYMLLIDCLGQEQTGRCPSVDRIALKEAVNDLCWALVERKLNVSSEAEVPLWRQLFQSLNARGAVQGECACCMMPEVEALRGHCRWTWLDKCSRIGTL